jgi:hypothetical protein
MSFARVPRDVIQITSGADVELFAEMCRSMQDSFGDDADEGDR